jgi:LuxR family maltose regulon positive regulatory protein
MTRAETALMLRACGLRLQPKSVELLLDRTEGWPAGLYLAALTLAAADDPDAAAERFAGDDRLVADYLRDELISTLIPAELRFLTRTSILDELSGELCDAVLGAQGSAEVLRRLARSNALVNRLDSRDHRYRYHSLLRGMLESELHRLEPREEAALHGRASRWYADRGDFDRAVPHAISARDTQIAGDLIWSQTPTYVSAGRLATIERWLERFTRTELDGTPTLCLARATYFLAQGDGPQVEHWTGHAFAVLEESPGEDREVLRVAGAAIRATGGAREEVARMRDDAVAAFELLPEGSPFRSLCCLVEGTSHHLAGDRDLARSVLERGARLGAVGAPHVRTLCLAQLALIALDEGDPEQAARFSEEVLEQADHYGLNDYPTSALLFAVSARVRARRGRTAQASRDARRAVRLLQRLNELSPWYEIEVRISVARALVMLDDVPAARAELAAAGRLLHRIPDAPVLSDWLEQGWLEADSETSKGRWPLTPAELRLLHYLPTHLTFREIAEELVVSTNTVKTQARSVYGKLGVSSRAEAVTSAQAAGLIEGDPSRSNRLPASADFTPNA